MHQSLASGYALVCVVEDHSFALAHCSRRSGLRNTSSIQVTSGVMMRSLDGRIRYAELTTLSDRMVAAALSMLAIAACNSDDGKPATDSGVKIDGAPLEDAALAKDALIADGALPADGRVVDGAALKWYRTCGDPVCKNQDAGPGGCTTQVEGASCTPKGIAAAWPTPAAPTCSATTKCSM